MTVVVGVVVTVVVGLLVTVVVCVEVMVVVGVVVGLVCSHEANEPSTNDRAAKFMMLATESHPLLTFNTSSMVQLTEAKTSPREYSATIVFSAALAALQPAVFTSTDTIVPPICGPQLKTASLLPHWESISLI